MKMLTALMAILTVSAAVASTSSAPKPNRVYSCSGLVARSGGPAPVGAPTVRVLEYLEKAGPMLPAFKSVYVLEVRPLNPMANSFLYETQFAKSVAMDVHVYDVLNADGEKTTYTIEHDIFRDLFTVKVAKGAFKYNCAAAKR